MDYERKILDDGNVLYLNLTIVHNSEYIFQNWANCIVCTLYFTEIIPQLLTLKRKIYAISSILISKIMYKSTTKLLLKPWFLFWTLGHVPSSLTYHFQYLTVFLNLLSQKQKPNKKISLCFPPAFTNSLDGIYLSYIFYLSSIYPQVTNLQTSLDIFLLYFLYLIHV